MSLRKRNIIESNCIHILIGKIQFQFSRTMSCKNKKKCWFSVQGSNLVINIEKSIQLMYGQEKTLKSAQPIHSKLLCTSVYKPITGSKRRKEMASRLWLLIMSSHVMNLCTFLTKNE